MRSHATWFVLLGSLCIAAPYLLGVAPRTRRERFYIALTIAFLAWLLLLMEPLRSSPFSGGPLMLAKLLPQRLDNGYQGRSVGLWLFGLVALVKSIQSLSIILAGGVTAKDADGIPLDTFPPVNAQTVLSVFAQQSLWRLTFCLICFIVLLRYRSAVPLMFAMFVANYLAGQLIFHFVPLPRIGTPPGPAVNLALFFLMVMGLILSLWQRTRAATQ